MNIKDLFLKLICTVISCELSSVILINKLRVKVNHTKMSALNLAMKFTGFDQVDDHIEFKITVKDSANNETWPLQARYKRLRQIYKDLKEVYGKQSLPDFPPKKMFGNFGQAFLNQRQQALETFFNNILKRYNIDDLESLKGFLLGGKKTVARNPAPPVQNNVVNKPAVQQQVPVNRPTVIAERKSEKNKNNKDLEKLISDMKRQFFDLNDRYEAEDDDGRKKKNIYKNFNLEIASEPYKLPKGDEANLICIHDVTLVAQDQSIQTLGLDTLDNIVRELGNIKFSQLDRIVVSVE